MTQRTRRAPSASSTTIGTLLRKAKPAAGALHLARAFARRTNDHRSTDVAGAIATRTLLRTIDRDVGGYSFDRFFKRKRERHLNVIAPLRLWPRRLFLFRCATTKQVRKYVAETAASTRACRCAAPV